jgi:DNA helicase HerA-like ATPase
LPRSTSKCQRKWFRTAWISDFIDEAHLIFNEASKALLDQIEMIVLIRSKGIGIYFVTQNPMDVPSVYWHN